MTRPRDAAARDAGNVTGSEEIGNAGDANSTAVDPFREVADAAERELAGSLLFASDRVVDAALERVTDEDLAVGTARIVVRVVRKLRAESRSIAPIIVAGRLEQEPNLTDELRRMPLSTLHSLAGRCLLPSLAPQLAEAVAERARRRDLAAVAGRLLRLANLAEPVVLRGLVDEAGVLLARLGAVDANV